jgi:acyl carrier protein
MDKTADQIMRFILDQFLEGEDPGELSYSTRLLEDGILDSLATLTVVTFLEETYGIKVEAHEANEDNFSSIEDIEKFVHSKLGAS